MPRTTSIESQDTYKKFLRSLELIGIALVKSNFYIDRNRYFDDEEERISINFSCEIANAEKEHFDVKANMTLKSARPETEKGSLTIDASYLMHFHTEGAVDSTLATKFAEDDARIVVWPYLREYVSSICSRAQVPPITLPLTRK